MRVTRLLRSNRSEPVVAYDAPWTMHSIKPCCQYSAPAKGKPRGDSVEWGMRYPERGTDREAAIEPEGALAERELLDTRHLRANRPQAGLPSRLSLPVLGESRPSQTRMSR